ncbi:HAD family hydrolase [Granulicella arctica]|uniref:HAD family hydrolase n=1 Tax=Granulicella arctica TaxID=940613 RepID=UPI0021E09D9D|nr:HAD hydrolase-like protein [Granulicella arctica]
MTLSLIVFDLDGTLIDSRVDLCNAVNATLQHLGRPALPQAVVATYIGDGVGMLIRRALGDPAGERHDDEYVTSAITYFLEYYHVHKLDNTYVYKGVLEALETIKAANPKILMAVLTNKPVNPSRAICAHFGLDRYFFQNYGGNSFHTKKPDPLGLQTLIAEAAALSGKPLTPSQTLMVGDSDVDILTARNCGARSLGCTFGLAPHSLAAAEPDATVDAPSEWPAAIDRLLID